MENLTRSILQSAANLEILAADKNFLNAFQRTISLVVEAYKQSRSLFVAGNGGSAADAQHIVAELVSKLERDRTPIRAFAMTVDTSILTAVGNDYGYEYLFERQVRGLMRPGDVFLAISTSGNSKNILAALKACRELGIKSVLLTGKKGGVASQEKLADIEIIVPGSTTAMIQEAHIVVYHLFCHAIEQALVAADLCHYR